MRYVRYEGNRVIHNHPQLPRHWKEWPPFHSDAPESVNWVVPSHQGNCDMLFCWGGKSCPQDDGGHKKMLPKWHASLEGPHFFELRSMEKCDTSWKVWSSGRRVVSEYPMVHVVFCFSIATSAGFCPSTDCVGSTLNPVTTRIIAYLGLGISTYTPEN